MLSYALCGYGRNKSASYGFRDTGVCITAVELQPASFRGGRDQRGPHRLGDDSPVGSM